MSDAEVARAYPCDAFVPDPGLALWRGVDAPGERIWPWLRMLRVGTYSYDLVDNLGRRSPRQLAELPDPVPGDRVMRAGTVLSATPGEQLTARIGSTVMSYVVAGDRLLLKLVVPAGAAARVLRPVLPLGDLVMARKQLRTLAALAQASPAATNSRP